MTNDEEEMLIPFAYFDEAVDFPRDLNGCRIGLALGVLGGASACPGNQLFPPIHFKH
jgi:hypothetical protein